MRLGVFLPSTSVGLRYGPMAHFQRGFSWQRGPGPFAACAAPRHLSVRWVPDLPETPPAGLDHENHLVAVPSLLRPPSGLGIRQPPGTGILTCCPSPTGFPLGLGTDSPWVDERCPGILRLSAKTVLASFNATHAGILSSFRSRCPFGHPSPRNERSSTTVHADSPQLRFHA